MPSPFSGGCLSPPWIRSIYDCPVRTSLPRRWGGNLTGRAAGRRFETGGKTDKFIVRPPGSPSDPPSHAPLYGLCPDPYPPNGPPQPPFGAGTGHGGFGARGYNSEARTAETTSRWSYERKLWMRDSVVDVAYGQVLSFL